MRSASDAATPPDLSSPPRDLAVGVPDSAAPDLTAAVDSSVAADASALVDATAAADTRPALDLTIAIDMTTAVDATSPPDFATTLDALLPPDLVTLPDLGTCGDGIRDGDETDVDCGGSCPRCSYGQHCLSGGDCVNLQCTSAMICALFTNEMASTSDARLIPAQIAVADLDGDNLLDVAVANGGNDFLMTYIGNGNGTFAGIVTSTMLSGNAGAETIALGDFDGNGLDALVATYSTGAQVQHGVGNGTFGTVLTTWSTGSSGYASPVAARDINGDGKVDAVFCQSSGSVVVAAGNGTGGFAAPVTSSLGITNPYSLQIADLDGDGKLDVIAHQYNQGIVAALGNGDGSFQTATNLSLGTTPLYAALADFNGDGKLDLAFDYYDGSSSTYTVRIALNTGAGTFGTPTQTKLKSAGALTVGDFDGDGHKDVVVVSGPVPNQYTQITALLGDGAGGVRVAGAYGTGGSFVDVKTGDMDQNGRLDVIVSDSFSYKVGVFLNLAP